MGKLNLSDWLAVLEWRRQPEPRYPGLIRGHIRRWSDAPVTTFIFSIYNIPFPDYHPFVIAIHMLIYAYYMSLNSLA